MVQTNPCYHLEVRTPDQRSVSLHFDPCRPSLSLQDPSQAREAKLRTVCPEPETMLGVTHILS